MENQPRPKPVIFAFNVADLNMGIDHENKMSARQQQTFSYLEHTLVQVAEIPNEGILNKTFVIFVSGVSKLQFVLTIFKNGDTANRSMVEASYRPQRSISWLPMVSSCVCGNFSSKTDLLTVESQKWMAGTPTFGFLFFTMP